MAEKPNPKSQPKKAQPSSQRRGQVAVPPARPAQEAPAPARPVRDPGTSRRPPSPTPAPPSTSVQSLAPATSRSAPSTQDAPSTRDSTEPAGGRVRVGRLTEAGLRQLGGISRHQRVLEWLDDTFTSRDEGMTELHEELQEELHGCCKSQERGND